MKFVSSLLATYRNIPPIIFSKNQFNLELELLTLLIYMNRPNVNDAVGQAAIKKHLTSFLSIYNKLDQLYHFRSYRDERILQPHFHYFRELLVTTPNLHNAADYICSHYLHHGINKQNKSPICVGCWSSDGRRLVLGPQKGQFTLWEVRN